MILVGFCLRFWFLKSILYDKFILTHKTIRFYKFIHDFNTITEYFHFDN
jgi:uncharacterized membrane protein YwzB